MPSFIFVHSPVVGPSTWRWVAEVLASRGHEVTVPTVPQHTVALGWEAFADFVSAQASGIDQPVVVGHSGAGPLLPQIQARARWKPGAMVFVDAAVPPRTGQAALVPPAFFADLRAMARDGVLPVFSDWFGPEIMKDLIPDDVKRAVVCQELPSLPVSFFEQPVSVPEKWATARCGYVQLSEPYAGEAAEAASRGWPVVQRLGGHLDIVTRPVPVADAILSIVGQLAG